MTTANDALASAEKWLGTTEQPPGSNNVPGVTDWYGIQGAWCAMWISRVFFDAGMPLPASTPKGFAWVSAGFDWFQRQGWLMFTDWRQARPGDLIAWEWGSTAGGFDHISMVWENERQFITIGGNERDRVKFEFFGAPGGAALFARPPFDPPPTPEPDDMTPEQAAQLNAISDAVASIQTGVMDPVYGLRTMVAAGFAGIETVRPDGTVNVDALVAAIQALPAATADEITRRLAS